MSFPSEIAKQARTSLSRRIREVYRSKQIKRDGLIRELNERLCPREHNGTYSSINMVLEDTISFFWLGHDHCSYLSDIFIKQR
jgi:hypothetical protein